MAWYDMIPAFNKYNFGSLVDETQKQVDESMDHKNKVKKMSLEAELILITGGFFADFNQENSKWHVYTQNCALPCNERMRPRMG